MFNADTWNIRFYLSKIAIVRRVIVVCQRVAKQHLQETAVQQILLKLLLMACCAFCESKKLNFIFDRSIYV